MIGVHIRRGDFKLGNQTTPLDYFVTVITFLRRKIGKELPVTVFTDADESEIEEVLKLPSVKLAEEKADILDLLLLSRSSILVLSRDSTFSYWAAFLSDAFVIMPSDDWQSRIKYQASDYAEARWNIDNPEQPELLERLLALTNLFQE